MPLPRPQAVTGPCLRAAQRPPALHTARHPEDVPAPRGHYHGAHPIRYCWHHPARCRGLPRRPHASVVWCSLQARTRPDVCRRMCAGAKHKANKTRSEARRAQVCATRGDVPHVAGPVIGTMQAPAISTHAFCALDMLGRAHETGGWWGACGWVPLPPPSPGARAAWWQRKNETHPKPAHLRLGRQSRR